MRIHRILPVILVLTASCSGSDVAHTSESDAESVLSSVVPGIAPAALQAAAQATPMRDFYAKNGWLPVWSPLAAQALTTALEKRARHGLDHVPFMPDLSKLSAEAREIALTRAALSYAGALAHGVADPAKLHRIYTLPRPKVNLSPGLITAVRAGRVEAWLDSLAPDTAEYAALAAAYLKQRQVMPQDNSEEIVGGDLIHPGDQDPRIPQIEAALLENRYLVLPVTTKTDVASNMYSKGIVMAVKAFQNDYGISDDGVIGADTLVILNVRPGDRARSIAVAMERLRWLTRNPPPTRIDVNTAAAELSYFREGKLVDQRNVVVGKPGNETPQISSFMFRLVANPTWTVPKSIQKGEMAGKNAAYFQHYNLSWRNGSLVQNSGPRNSLGLVKFDLNNEFAIYLHDTPAKTLFDKNQRQLSHGCVRVNEALGFAHMLADREGIADQWTKALATGKMTFVKLPQMVPVRLMYRTVYVDQANQLMYRTDPYGWNVAVAAALGFTKDASRQFRSGVDDIGP
ncbi:L,D-transpeptidase family protein [Aquisediminimonas sediminicola]|uniref:L,D-transpeptidase family protein n=1 Tax=Alteraquisediminimonas sediminicola TaxID=2676787 RepID=UPI001FEA948B|nr:L,D-transpeptidase family protein [Aquisediminimonas sediminicola]